MAQRERWTIFRTRYTPVLWPIITYWDWPVKPVLGVEQGTVITLWQKGKLTGYRESTAMERIAHAALEIFKKNIDNLQKMRETAVKAGEEAVELTKAFAAKAKTASLEEFLKFFEEFDTAYQKVSKTSIVYWIYTAPAVEEEIKNKLAGGRSEIEIAEIFATMSKPTDKSYGAIAEEEFEKIVQTAQEKGIETQKVKSAIANFSQKYFWLPYEYIGPEVWDKETVAKRVDEAVAKPPAENKAEKKNTVEKQKQCIAKYSLSKDVADLFKILQVMTLMQDDRKMYQSHTCYYLDGIIVKELAKRLGVTLQQARYIDIKALKQFIESGNETELKKKLQSREELMVKIQTEHSTELYEGREAAKQLEIHGIALQEDYSTVKELKGQVANRGYAKGIARVLHNPNPQATFNEGDILVTGMTTPAYIGFIKKASAIVTNEGGITCHAAIISRELGKPCVIGTKIATKVLKDGQEIEVDADKGIVKILS